MRDDVSDEGMERIEGRRGRPCGVMHKPGLKPVFLRAEIEGLLVQVGYCGPQRYQRLSWVSPKSGDFHAVIFDNGVEIRRIIQEAGAAT